MQEAVIMEKTRKHAFAIDTLARLLQHLAQNEDLEIGNREILLEMIARELQSHAEEILKS